MSNFIHRTIETMIYLKFIPIDGYDFNITNELIFEYIKVYGEITKGGQLRNREIPLARRLAGLNLLKLKLARGSTTKNCREGMVYLIGNPAWPNMLKVGMSIDVDNRLASYQMYDPTKSYFIKHYEFVQDRRAIETFILQQYNLNIESGEWLRDVDGKEIIQKVRKYIGA